MFKRLFRGSRMMGGRLVSFCEWLSWKLRGATWRILFCALFIVLIFSSCLNKCPGIQEIDSLEQASTPLGAAGKNSLVVFDIDDTLTYPTDTIRQTEFWSQHSAEGQAFYKKLDEHIKKSVNPDEVSATLMSKIFLAEKPLPVEPQTASFIQKIQARGIKVIALSSWPAGKLGVIPSMQAWPFDKLAQLGIDFSTSFGSQEIALKSANFMSHKHPVFYKGILLTDGMRKGDVLGAFLDVVNYKPDQIFYFDDKVKEIESVKNEVDTRGIPFHGFIYKAASKLPHQHDPAVIELQNDYLINRHEYITEEQARELLKSSPQIIVTPKTALIDEPVEISITNLKPNLQISIEAVCKNKDNDQWQSYATFQADEHGVVNVAKQAPIKGSYTGIDPMGLFWSMVPSDKEILKKIPNTFDFHEIFLSILIDGKVQAEKTIHRLAVAPNVEKREIREQGLIGTLFYPKNIQHRSGIIIVGGSGGRIPEDVAQLLASHGYVAFALGFFGVPGLPERLQNIPLEYFQTAMQWFKSQPEVDKNHIAILGRSRGGELVLLLGATFPQEMQAIVAYVPGAFIADESWTYKNKPLRGIPYPSDEQETEAIQKGLIAQHTGTFDDPEESTSKYKWVFGTASKDVLDAAAIQVEKIQCPILLLSAEDDKMWQSTDFSNIIMQRLDEKKSMIARKHFHFPNAGHGVQNPYGPSIAGYPYFHPKIKKWHTIGGTREGNARANEQAWKAVLEFLKETLEK